MVQMISGRQPTQRITKPHTQAHLFLPIGGITLSVSCVFIIFLMCKKIVISLHKLHVYGHYISFSPSHRLHKTGTHEGIFLLYYVRYRFFICSPVCWCFKSPIRSKKEWKLSLTSRLEILKGM